MILVAQRGEYVGKLIVLSLDESEKIIYDKIMKIVGESDICVDKTLLKEQEPMRIGELYIQSEQHKVLKRDQEVRLTNIEFRILYVLALHQGSMPYPALFTAPSAAKFTGGLHGITVENIPQCGGAVPVWNMDQPPVLHQLFRNQISRQRWYRQSTLRLATEKT